MKAVMSLIFIAINILCLSFCNVGLNDTDRGLVSKALAPKLMSNGEGRSVQGLRYAEAGCSDTQVLYALKGMGAPRFWEAELKDYRFESLVFDIALFGEENEVKSLIAYLNLLEGYMKGSLEIIRNYYTEVFYEFFDASLLPSDSERLIRNLRGSLADKVVGARREKITKIKKRLRIANSSELSKQMMNALIDHNLFISRGNAYLRTIDGLEKENRANHFGIEQSATWVERTKNPEIFKRFLIEEKHFYRDSSNSTYKQVCGIEKLGASTAPSEAGETLKAAH